VRGVETGCQIRNEDQSQREDGAIDERSCAVTGLGTGGADEEGHDQQNTDPKRSLDGDHSGKSTQGESETLADITSRVGARNTWREQELVVGTT